MQLKVFTHLLALAYLLTCRVTSLSAYPGGCYECEEEVWEEVPCDEIPSNSTTIEPPYTTPKYTRPITTTPQPTITTRTTPVYTTTTTTTSTTPSPVETSTSEKSPYEKCYCECKVGCKEFCRKVVVNPDVEKKVVQVSRISEKVDKGNVELTHFHQRKLIPKIGYVKPPPAPTYEAKPYVPQYPPSPIIYTPETSLDKTPALGHSVYSAAPWSQVSAKSYAHAHAGPNSIGPNLSYNNKPVAQYYSEPSSALYDFPIPFEGIYSNVVKSIHEPGPNSIQLTLPSSNNIVNHNVHGQKAGSYFSSIPVNNSPFKAAAGLSNAASYDSSLESYIKDFLNDDGSHNVGPVQTYAEPHYSISYR